MNKKNKMASIQLALTRVLVYAIILFLCFLCLFFFVMLIVNASRTNNQLQRGFTLIPGGHFFYNMKNAFADASIQIPSGMMNSFIVAASSALLTTYFSALTAYGLYVYDFKLKKLAYTFIIAVMMIPTQVSAVGFVQLVYKYGMNNKLWVLIVPSIAAPAVFYYMHQYLKATLPLDIVEASRIDGASEFGTFNRIVLPIMKPAMAVQMIFSFVAAWNNYFLPALLLTKAGKKTVPIMIAQLRSADYSKFDMGKVYMFILLAILPVIVVYMFLSKSIIKGVTSGSVKG
ncbi:multiple sugar transport system permease protein [Lachnospiraceae bacterium XBB1006]|nr:multiple sugar transport system permease protein [Lachnospiraceae bacterium XBB1006]